jgi:uncharacterized protein YkwD
MTTGRSPLAAVLGVLAVLLAGCFAVEVPVSGSAPGMASAPAAQSPPPADASSAEEQMARAVFDRVNAERAERGLEPVEWNEELAAVARSWSAEMARRGQIQHQDVGAVLQREVLSGFQGIGENVFQATGPVPAGTIHAGWMRSDDHRVNVLNPGWDRLGIGVHCAEDGSVWATQEFGRTVGSDRPAVATSTPPQEPIVRPDDDGPGCG